MFSYFLFRQMPLVSPSPGSVSLETWLVEKEERVKLCKRLEYAGRGVDLNDAAAVFFPPSSAHLHNQPSSVLPLFPLPSSTIPQREDEKEEEFIFPDSPIQPLGMYDYDQDDPLQPLDFFDYVEAVPEEEGQKGEEGAQDVAEKDGDDGSALINLGKEDVNNDLEENFEMGSLEELFEGEEKDSSAEDGGEETRDLEEMFAAAESSFEKADDDSKEDVSNDTTTDASVETDFEVSEEDDELNQGDAGSANDVGGSAIFDSIDLVRQAVEFLTVSN